MYWFEFKFLPKNCLLTFVFLSFARSVSFVAIILLIVSLLLVATKCVASAVVRTLLHARFAIAVANLSKYTDRKDEIGISSFLVFYMT